MEIFNGRREININEGETASSISATRVSNPTEKAQQLADNAQRRFGGAKDTKATGNKRQVQFEDEP